MENLGYKEGSAKPRRISRTTSIIKNEQEQPLDNGNNTRYKAVPPNLMVRWRNNPEAILDAQYPAEDFAYMECGPSPPAESVPSMYDSFDEPASELSVQICADTLRADIYFCDQNGISALHLAAFSGCLTSANFLISKGVDVNLQPKCYTPLHCAAFGNSVEVAKLLLNNGALLTLDTNKPNCEESLLHCAVRANALECLSLFIEEGADVNSLKPNGTNSIHLAADLGNVQCLEILLNANGADPNIRICIREKESTALHLAADEGNVECVDLLLSKGADAKLKNHRGFTALHLAARTSSLECVESLLRNGNADANAEDFDHRTPLHAAIGKSENAFDILETLISWGANVNHKDIYGFTALHLAALDGLAQCVEMLIFHGADVTTKSKKGTSALNVITRKTPASVAMIQQKLDAAITLHHSQDPVNREVELELDFRHYYNIVIPEK
uniref:Uncharacterized protein n=1 Tax=Megaselia scalaris TaxID=36166 RepID=T1H3H4_MEGSC